MPGRARTIADRRWIRLGQDAGVHPVRSVFEPLCGSPSWLVRKGIGSFVTMEFGNPSLEVGEVRSRAVRIDDAAPRTFRMRSSLVHGEWHLWIYCCLWSLTSDGIELAHSESEDIAIHRALRVLDGQALVGVDVDGGDGSTTFSFDLGCVLATRPAPDGSYAEEPVDQWMLYQPSGQVLTVRGDGRFAIQHRSEPEGSAEWRPLAT